MGSQSLTRAAAQSVYRQVHRFFDAFHATQRELIQKTDGGCVCEACRHIGDLRLKAVVHFGKALFKRIQELAGEDVILVHRLLKNSIDEHECIALTDAFYRQHSELVEETFTQVTMHYDIGTVTVHVFSRAVPKLPLTQSAPLTKFQGILEIFARTGRA